MGRGFRASSRLHECLQDFVDPGLITCPEAAEKAEHISIKSKADGQLGFSDIEYQISRPTGSGLFWRSTTRGLRLCRRIA
jgi:hypothetical protein